MSEPPFTMTGNLTDNPDVKFTRSGAAYAKFTVAYTPRFYDKTKNEWRDGEPLFLNCTAWRDLATNIGESLGKGARVIVTGRLRQNRWETKEGEKRSMIVLDVDDIGPSLRFASATVKKLERTSAGNGTASGQGDAWAGNWSAQSDEPPF
jgi:single-strand DNA-binding protein